MTATLLPPRGVAPTPRPQASRVGSRWRHGLLGGAAAGLLAYEVVDSGPTLSDAFGTVLTAQPGWLAVALLSAAASMSMFARSRRRLLRAAGVDVPLRTSVAAVYVANALHTTLPGGAAFSTAYTYRWMRSWGASRPVATWTLASGGVVASASLAPMGLLGSLLVGGGAGWLSLALATAGAGPVGLAVRYLQRSPHAAVTIGRWTVRRVNALRRRPLTTGLDVVEETIAQLRGVRPTGRDWLVATAFAFANWAFDVGCLAACAAAVGVQGLTLAVLLLAYTAGMAASSLSLLPGGLGVVDAALVLTLVAGGIPAAAALPAVLLYRLISLGGVVAVGWTVAAVQGLHHRAPAEAMPAEAVPAEAVPAQPMPVDGDTADRDRVVQAA